jgi:DNA-binding PucR family transcriptional regulator
MLAGLASDPEAQRAAAELLEPLRRYAEGTSRDLLQTLAVYLEENCNTSSAARRLYLNRHSLIYRLKKIEELTGRDLASHEDRLILEVSLRIRTLSGPPEPAA